MKSKMKLILGLMFTLGCVLINSTFAQTINGTISGTVTDAQSAVVSGATVTVTNKETGASRTLITNDDGSFRFSGLAIGIYTVKTEKTGFGIATNDNVEVSVASDSNIQINLETGAVGATVDVSTTAGEVLDTTQSQVSKTVSSQQILELPGRNNLNGLALLNPGVLPSQNGRPGSGFAVNGNRTRSNNFTIDGANNNNQSLATPLQNLPPEALQQFQIITNTFAAEFGRNAGSYVNQITRSGTNEFHGTLFYTWAGNGVDALTTNQQRSFNANVAALGPRGALRNARSVQVDNTYGFTVGGPIAKDHTFFFVSIDSNDFRTTVSSAARVALSAQARQRLQLPGRSVDPGAVAFLLNNFPAANDPTPQGSLPLTGTAAITCPASDPQCNVLPLEVFNRGRTAGIPYATQFDRGLFKINTRINSNDQLSFRYLVDKNYDPGQPVSLPGQEIGSVLRNDSFTINDAYVLSPKFLNEARFTYSRRYFAPIENLGPQYAVGGTTAFNIGNLNYPQSNLDNVYEITDNFSYTPANHSLKFGYNLLIYKLQSFFAPTFRGSVQYPSIVDFLQDTNATYSRFAGDGLTTATTYENSFFAQDDWRVSPDLTLNLGVRYEYVTAPLGFFSNAKPDINNVAPRIGAAWNPKDKFGGKLVLRGGFAISYDQVFQNILTNNSRNFPRGVSIALSNVSGQRFFAGLPTPPPPSAFTGNPNFLPLRLFSPNERIRQPMSYQGTVSLQYQLFKDYVFKAEYITTQGRNLIREVETNYGFCGASNPLSKFGTSCTAAPEVLARERIDPTRGSVLVGQGIAESSYHAGQFTLEKRYSKVGILGLNFGDALFNANYTYSAFISESEDILGGQTNRTIPADPRNPKLDRARSGFDQPHRFVVSFVVRTPKILTEYGKFLSTIASDWELTGVGTLASGTPYSVLNSNNALGVTPGQIETVQLSQRVSVNPNGQFPLVSTPTTPNPNAYFIVNGASSGILGNLGANTLRTGGTQNLNLGVVKEFRTFSESQRIQFRAEISNVFNHRNFTVIPTNSLANSFNAAFFLNLGQQNVTGRTFNFGARYFF